MSIIIRDGYMPSECEYCPLCRYYPENKRVWCNATNRILKNVWENADWTHLGVKKPDWCPLVEIPKGAKLIDAKELKNKVLKWLPPDPCGIEEKEYPFETDICVSMLMEIDDAPTIFGEGKE